MVDGQHDNNTSFLEPEYLTGHWQSAEHEVDRWFSDVPGQSQV